ncbi:hypothetical protein HNQ40_000653 [Algisphaera agarilytica]|uniref:Uncharacterized protein n=1 Tax=Algisphaera agarilytica TaxID=1385975 RepID=A0A7X0H3Y1_9BACT|nr:hypothetical protein [Algisphaera agarilytica]
MLDLDGGAVTVRSGRWAMNAFWLKSTAEAHQYAEWERGEDAKAVSVGRLMVAFYREQLGR